jgi:hypothetical protein
MLFLQYIMINLVLTKSSGPKRHAIAFTAPIFAGFCVCNTDLSGGGVGGGEAGGTGLHNRASVQVGGGWVAVGVGGKPLNRAKIRSRQKCVRLFTDCRFHRPLSIFYVK